MRRLGEWSCEIWCVDKEEVVQPLDGVYMECGKEARCVESCFGDEFVGRVGAEGEERGETSDGG